MTVLSKRRISRDILGVDVGGTKIAAGIVRLPEGRVIAHRIIPTQPQRGSAGVLNDLASLLDRLTAESKVKVFGTGVGLCELVSREGEIMSHATLRWKSRQVRHKLARFGPLVIDADVRAAGRAEAIFGAGRDYRNFLYVSVGTGISCCLLIDGQPYLGTRGATGTMASGNWTLRCDQCRRVQTHSTEDVASGRGLVERFRRAGGNPKRAEDVFNSDTYTAMEVLEEGGQALANGLAMLVDVLDPQAVIVGGGLGLAGGIYWKSLVRYTRQNIWSDVSRRVPIRRASLGAQAGVIGAAAGAWSSLFSSK